MKEFSSISVSSYEAGALAERLTEQSAEGWSVVAIVPTGSTVTAYLSRATGDSSAADDETAASAPAAATASAAMLVGDDEAAAQTGTDHSFSTSDEPQASAEPADEPADEPAGDEAASSDDPVTEAPGWAASTTTEAAAPTDFAPSAPAAAAPADAGAMGAAASAAGAAPAGWYADPSSRFELRYWDGSQWTEHVSRAGQQYTDPPVA